MKYDRFMYSMIESVPYFQSPFGAPKMAGVLGEPSNLDLGSLPRGIDVFNFYKKARQDGIEQGR